MAVPASGRRPASQALGAPGRIIIYDVARDGRWLASRKDIRLGVHVRVPGQAHERDLSWLGSAIATSLSADGQWLVLAGDSRGAGANYGVVLRKTDGSPAVRLGEGNPQDLSPDGKWVAAIISTPPQLVAYPTGPGQPVHFNRGSVERYRSATWFPDSA